MTLKSPLMRRLVYAEKGEGRPVVLLHGFPLDARLWEGQVAGLSDRWRVVAPDLPGFGHSHSEGPFTMDSLARRLHHFLSEIGALPCVLGGLSMGGYVALAYARRYPADLRGLALVDSRAEADTAEGKVARQEMIELVRREGAGAVAERMERKMLAESTLLGRPDITQKLRRMMEQCPPKTIEYAVAAMRDREDQGPFLGSIAIPTLVVVGQEDAITPVDTARAMQRAIAGAQLEIIPDAGHASPLEQPGRVTEAFERFLQSMT